MKKIKLLLLGIVSILGISLSSASFTISGVTYEDGFYRNENKGLITFIQGENIATFQDKNLGATEVYDGTPSTLGSIVNAFSNSSKNISVSPCSQLGNLYQWGNDYAFNCSGVYNGEYNLSSTIDLDSSISYSRNGTHLNSSSLYNPASLTQSSFNAWGGETATPESQQGVCPDGYYIPNKTDVENFESMLGSYFGTGLRNSYNYIFADGYSLSYYLKLPVFSYNNKGAFPEYSSNFLSSSSYIDSDNHVLQKYFGFKKSTDDNMNLLVSNDKFGTYYFFYYFNSSIGIYLGSRNSNANYSSPSVLAPVRCFRSFPLLPSNSWVALTGGDTSILPPEIDSGGDTPQDFESPVQGGIRDYNTMLIEKAILCYMSDGSFGGEYGDCAGINYSGFINQYQHDSPIWSGSSVEDYKGDLLFYDAQPVLSNYCVNTNLIQYPFCSQLDLYSGAYLLYFFENGKLDYYVLGDGFGVDLGNLGSGQLGELTCQGAWCDTISQGLPEYIFPTNSGNNNDFGLSGDIISEDFYNDFIEKGFRFKCPYSYSGSYFVLGKDLINRLGGRDLMIPVNCFVSAFSQGRKMLFFGDPEYGKYWSGSLINGNTPGHQRLFLFFDLVLSLGIIVVLSKLFKLLTTKK